MDSLLADPQQVYWPVYIAFFDDGFGVISQAIFVEDDCASESGRLMDAQTFQTDPMVGTKYTTLTRISLRDIPTYIGKNLKGHIKPMDLYRADVICRTIEGLCGPASSRRASKPWTEPAWAQLKTEGIVQPIEECSV